MPQQITNNPISFPSLKYSTLSTFRKGVITLLDKSRIPTDALEEAQNCYLYEDGQPGPRPGTDYFGTAPTFYSTGTASQSGITVTGAGTTFTAAMVGMTIVFSTGESAVISTYVSATSITVGTSQTVSSTTYVINAPFDGFDYFDFNGAGHLVCAAGGNVYRSTDDATTWTACTGATYTAGTSIKMNQYNSFLYLTGGVDIMILYDGSTTLSTYTSLATPAAPTVVETGTGLTSGTNYHYYYRCCRANNIGVSIRSDPSTVIDTGLAREDWTPGTNYATLTMPTGSVTQTAWDIFVSEDGVNYYYLDSTSASSGVAGVYVDDGTAIVVPTSIPPTVNTTQGPLVEELTNVGSRMYGIRDTTNRYRIWFTSGNYPYGSFSTAFDGGYLDWQTGGKFIPQKVEDYRDGKGTPLATIWCSSADGQGCIIQMSLDQVTVGDITVIIPSAYKLPGSRGTPAPGSVVNVLNDYMFYNTQAFYNLGSRVNFQNLLSTDESSANIRPDIKTVTNSAESGITSTYYDAKVLFSVPIGSSVNNRTIVYDTERRAWLPEAFMIGFSKFLRYTDTSGANRLLAHVPGATKLCEISTSIQGDFGVAFNTSLSTGLYPTLKNRFEFMWVEEGEIEVSESTGTVYVELIGIERSRGFSVQNSEVITSAHSLTGWSSKLWSTTLWSDASDATDTFTESSIKKYFNVQKELNAYQWRITTQDLNSSYTLRTLQISGTQTDAGKPTSWRIG